VALVLLAAGVAFGGYFASEAIDGTGVAQEPEEPTAAAPAADSSPTPAVTAEPSAEPTTPPTVTQPTEGALGCVECEVKGGQALRVTAEDIQLGPDGKYYVPDRGDGCAYREVEWGPLRTEGWVTLHDPACEVFWTYLPATGEVQAWTP
jgi:hypothetical protein